MTSPEGMLARAMAETCLQMRIAVPDSVVRALLAEVKRLDSSRTSRTTHPDFNPAWTEETP